MGQTLPMLKFVPLLSFSLILSACVESNSSQPKQAVRILPDTTAAAAKNIEMTPEQRGAKIFKRCRACHTLDEGGRNKVGPNLWEIYGSAAAAKEGFAYSKAMKSSGIIWDKDAMDAYLLRPAKFVPGTKMSFIGLKKQEDRDAVQAYIQAKTSP